MKYTVFEYVLLQNVVDAKPFIIDTGFVVAQTQEKARLIAARKIADNIDVETVEVLVRPF